MYFIIDTKKGLWFGYNSQCHTKLYTHTRSSIVNGPYSKKESPNLTVVLVGTACDNHDQVVGVLLLLEVLTIKLKPCKPFVISESISASVRLSITG